MDSDGTVTGRRALLATCGTVAFGSGVAYFAAGGELSADSPDADADRSPATGNLSGEPTAREDVDRTNEPTDEPGDEESTETETETPEEDPELTTGVDLDLSRRPTAGAAEAPVDVYYWTDYLCSFCERFETETFPKLSAEYVDSGRVRLVLLGYPLRDEGSWTALGWSRCVWRQVGDDDPAAFWDWHAAVFEEQSSDGHDWASDETFREITAETDGVPLEPVETCRESHEDEVRTSVEADADAARAADIQGTPGFVMYNRETGAETGVAGAQPYENFVDAIEDVAER